MLLGNRRAMRGGSRAVELEPPDPASADIVLEDMGQSVEAMNYEGKKACAKVCDANPHNVAECRPPSVNTDPPRASHQTSRRKNPQQLSSLRGRSSGIIGLTQDFLRENLTPNELQEIFRNCADPPKTDQTSDEILLPNHDLDNLISQKCGSNPKFLEQKFPRTVWTNYLHQSPSVVI